jgi:hypothetical protein
MRGYRLELLDDDQQWGIIVQEDDKDVPESGVVRNGISDALFWIRTQEDKRNEVR